MQKRSLTDRRKHSVVPRFPLRDLNDKLVSRDRRSRPDRRLAAGLEVEWREMMTHAAGGYTK